MNIFTLFCLESRYWYWWVVLLVDSGLMGSCPSGEYSPRGSWSWGAFHQVFCQCFSLTNFISYWNPCIWLAESKFCQWKTLTKHLMKYPPRWVLLGYVFIRWGILPHAVRSCPRTVYKNYPYLGQNYRRFLCLRFWMNMHSLIIMIIDMRLSNFISAHFVNMYHIK